MIQSNETPPIVAEGEGGPAAETSLLGLVNVLLRHRSAIFLGIVVGAALAAATTLLRAPTFTAETAFTPQAPVATRSPLAGMAAQLGFTLPTSTPDQSPAFYAALVSSRAVLDAVAATPVGVSARPAVGLDAIAGRSRDQARRLERTIRYLQSHTVALLDKNTGIVRLRVTSGDGRVARDLAAGYLRAINRFNLETRQSQASAERRFVQAQLDSARASLNASEERLRAFAEENRRVDNAPQLVLERERLQRRIAVADQLVTSLTQSFEQARIEEVRNTPVLTVIDTPRIPPAPDGRHTLPNVVLGAFLGFVLLAAWAFGREYLARQRRSGVPEIREFEELRKRALVDVLHPWRIVRERREAFRADTN